MGHAKTKKNNKTYKSILKQSFIMPFVKIPKKREPLWKQHDQLAQKEGLRHAVYDTNGGKYVGEWHNNLKHGKGEMLYSNKELYDGDWAEGKRNGFGTLSKLDKKIYVGGWKDDLRDGKGMNYYSDCEFYEGEWKDDMQNGQGLLSLANGNHFEGEFFDGKKNGHGSFFYRTTAQIYKGVWKDNIPKCGEFSDMDRVAAPKSTPFEIPNIELKDARKVLTDASLDYLRQ